TPVTVTAGNGSNGSTVVNSDNTITYTPDNEFNGTDTFTYTVTDTEGDTATATVTVTVKDKEAPTATTDSASTSDNTPTDPLHLLPTRRSSDLTPVTVTAGNGSNGSTVVNSDNTITYTPDNEFNGTDTFTYTVTDTEGDTATATVTVTV